MQLRVGPTAGHYVGCTGAPGRATSPSQTSAIRAICPSANRAEDEPNATAAALDLLPVGTVKVTRIVVRRAVRRSLPVRIGSRSTPLSPS
jgi:hypothetical protein